MKTTIGKVAVIAMFLLEVTNCSKKSDEVLPQFTISDLTYDNAAILITNQPTFDVSGTLKFTGAHNGVASLKFASSLGADVTVPVSGVADASGTLVGFFTFAMIQTPGTYSFNVWLIDGGGRASNKLSGSVKLISAAASTPVTLLSVAWDASTKTPLLTWARNNDSNFKAYAIVRHQGGASYEAARIVDQNVTSAHDPVSRMAIGYDATFSVDVINQVEVASPGNQIQLTHGTSLPFLIPMPGYAGDRPVLSSTRNEMYLFESYGAAGILAVSTTTNTVLRNFTINSNINHIALSKDDSKLYVVSYDVLRILNAADFSLIKLVNLTFKGGAIVCGRSDRLYVVSNGAYNGAPDTGKIIILDAGTGGEIGDLGIVVPDAFLSISPDANTLYVANPSSAQSLPLSHKGNVYQVDVSTDATSVSQQRETSDFIRAIQLSGDGQILFVAHDFDYPATPNKFVDAWSTTNLQSIFKLTTSHPVFDFVTNETSLFISVGEGDNSYFGVSKFDLSTKGELASWEFLYPGAHFMQVSQDKKYLYAFEQDKTWLVSLQ
jgi:hypothetical protein